MLRSTLVSILSGRTSPIKDGGGSGGVGGSDGGGGSAGAGGGRMMYDVDVVDTEGRAAA